MLNLIEVFFIILGVKIFVLSSFLFIVVKVRLSGSNIRGRGRVEIHVHEFGWSTVCDDSWDIHDGDVVCRQLGFPRGAKEVRFAAYYGEGSGRILLDEVNCKSVESNLLDCVHSGINRHDCSHEEDAGVDCNGQYISTKPYLSTSVISTVYSD